MKNVSKPLNVGMASLLAPVFSLAAYAHEGDPGVVGHTAMSPPVWTNSPTSILSWFVS